MNEQAADFRALREQVGFSQQDVADLMGVNVSSAKRWERPDYPFSIPDAAWELLESAYELQRQEVEYAVDQIVHAASVTRQGSRLPVVLSYWRTQADYDEAHPNQPGPYGQANAISRAVAEKARALGFEVDFVYGSPVPTEANEASE